MEAGHLAGRPSAALFDGLVMKIGEIGRGRTEALHDRVLSVMPMAWVICLVLFSRERAVSASSSLRGYVVNVHLWDVN